MDEVGGPGIETGLRESDVLEIVEEETKVLDWVSISCTSLGRVEKIFDRESGCREESVRSTFASEVHVREEVTKE